MTAKRIVAVLVAAALIGIAFVVRRTVLDDDTTTAATTTARTAPPAAAQLVCVNELAAACRAVANRFPDLAVRVESAGTTLDALATATATGAPPMWATIQPFPTMADTLRAEPLGFTTTPLAASRLAVATPKGARAAALATGCVGTPLWRCIGSHAGASWTELGGDDSLRTVRPSLGAVDREAVALASFANAVAGYVGGAQINTGALDADPAFGPWVRRLARAVPVSALSAGTPLATMLTRAGEFDLAATTDAELAALGGERVDANYPEPSMWAEAVLAVPAGASAPDGLAQALTEALASTGWTAAGSATQQLPDATTMLALRSSWQGAAG